MQKTVLIVLLLSTALAGKAQNLVQNGDFEQFSPCPNFLGQIDSATYWNNPTGTSPDYFNQCAPAQWAGVPANYLGYQYAKSGVAYAGLHRWTQSPANYREYIEGTLTAPLIAGQCYHLEMYMNLSNRSKFTSPNIGVYFSDTLIDVSSSSMLLYTPQINNPSGNNPDTLSWTLVSGNFTANGGENYFIIGNFSPDSSTITVIYNPQSTVLDAYVYIDVVCLTPCGSSCFTTIPEQNNSEAITIYPNPVKDELFIKSNSFTGKSEIKITDILGKEIYRDQLQTLNFKLQTSNYLPGIYFIEINNGNEIFRKKFLKQ